jgi:hypothetical protein
MECSKRKEDWQTCIFLMKQLIVKDINRTFSGNSFQSLTEEETLYGRSDQDSATAHTARMSIQALCAVFRDRNISSADLNPCDFFFCGSLKDKVYNSTP